MQLFQIRKMDGSKSTGIIIKIVGVSERVHNGETTIYIHYGNDIEQKVQSTDKIFKIAWEYHNGKYDRVDKEIKFEEFHDWLIEKLSGEWTK